SVIFIGVLMLIGGIGQLIHAWRVKQLAGFLFWTASGLLYAAAGIIALVNPITGAAMLTLLLGATLIAVGALRLWIWFNNRGSGDGSGWHCPESLRWPPAYWLPCCGPATASGYWG